MEEIATDSGIEELANKDKSTGGEFTRSFPTPVLEISVVQPTWLHESGKNEGGSNRVTKRRRAQLITVAENFSPSFRLGTFRWMCGLVGVDVVMFYVQWQKL